MLGFTGACKTNALPASGEMLMKLPKQNPQLILITFLILIGGVRKVGVTTKVYLDV